tara:strand:+ start:38 stop:166 length:129 start_codon:yes stop_codon:yes gene_type:complete
MIDFIANNFQSIVDISSMIQYVAFAAIAISMLWAFKTIDIGE